MAGHSKWANIKHKKAAQDAKRGKIFTKLIREITVAARLGGYDKDSNPRLRVAISTALSNNITKETVERAVKKGAGVEDGQNLEDVRYEGYGLSGVAVIVDCMTDNRNRTVAEVRHAFSKSGGNLGTEGSVSYMFNKKGVVSFQNQDEDLVMETAIDLGADDIIVNGNNIDVITNPADFVQIKEGLQSNNINSETAEIILDADNKIMIDDVEIAQKIINMIDRLEDLDDVQNVYTNVDFSENVLNKIH